MANRRIMNWLPLLIVAVVLIAFFLLKRTSLVPADTARQLLQQGALVVDVRTPSEFASGHLPRAVNIPLSELQAQIARRVPDKNEVLLLHCLSGARSGVARRQLQRMGYPNVFNLGSYRRAQKIVQEVANAPKQSLP